uniref:Zinc finger and SCAN domain-containing protein 5C n=1 Tax=Culex pipiens TaxID=7175 RepID=A0A8D8B5M3_CULPI
MIGDQLEIVPVASNESVKMEDQSFGISFYSEEQQDYNPPPVLPSAAPQIEPNYSKYDLGEGYFSYYADDPNVPERSSCRAASPALSDILNEFSVPGGIVPLETSASDSSDTEDDPEVSEKAIAINVSDDDSSSPSKVPKTKKSRGRKRLQQEVVIPGKWYCKECARNFMSQAGLTQHINTRHSRLKPHRCDVCSKRFDFLQEMKDHRERHAAKNKPFACSFDGCTKRFVYRYDMDRHFLTNHGEAPHPCKLCDRGFGRMDQLQKHLQSHRKNTNFRHMC